MIPEAMLAEIERVLFETAIGQQWVYAVVVNELDGSPMEETR